MTVFLRVILAAACLTACDSALCQMPTPFGPIPTTISEEAQQFLRSATPFEKEFFTPHRTVEEWRQMSV